MRQAKVRNAGLALSIQENVRWLDISVRYATRVGVIDGGGDLLQDPDGVQRCQSAFAQKRGKTPSRGEAHAHPRNALVDSARKNGNDGGMIESGNHPRLVFKPRGE